MSALPQNYDPQKAEKHWQQHWENTNVYAWDEAQPRENTFVIDTPPPTVSGVLHMGHIFSYTQADFVARYQRMSGKTVFYPMGFDDNGLPTERLVEKTKKIQAHRFIAENGREAFVEMCREVVKEAEEEFRRLFKSVALSVDWSQEYQTISDDVQRLSQASFIDLYNKQQAYRDLKPFFWDPVDQTAIAQAEIVDKELSSHFNDILFGIEGSDATITIGTTRPELIPACVAIFYHPDDKRYQHLKGKQAVTPLFGVKVPILEDDAVEMDKGTGIMMCCTFGDEADIQKWKKHNLETRVVLNKYGKMDFTEMLARSGDRASHQPAELCSMENSGEFSGNIYEKLNAKKTSNPDPKNPGARETIIQLLKDADLLVKQDAIKHVVKCAERSGAPLEILPTHQWFVRVEDKQDALKARAAECGWHPGFMQHRINQWIDGLSSDWCISRQRYFGVPFPVWYSKRAGEEGKIILASADQLPVNPLSSLPKGYSAEEVIPDADVMDTWATSSLTPQISAHSLTPTDRYNKLFPADIRPQAHEIIRTWAFYTIVKAHLHASSIPWKHLMISGWCLAPDKTKMSKSKGNVITPVELIEEKGADAVRYWASTSRLGADTAYSEDTIKVGRKLVTKLFNATKFAAQHLEHDDPNAEITETLDKWILTRLHRTVAKATTEFERFEYCDARVAIEDFFWKDFCDNYLELVKMRAYGEGDISPQARASAIRTLSICLEAILKLFAPFVPHITEELYSHIFNAEQSIHARGSWPKAASFPVDEQAEQSGIACVAVLELIRKAKSERQLSIKYAVESLTIAATAEHQKTLEPVMDDLKAAGNVVDVNFGTVKDGAATEDGAYALAFTFAEKSDVA